jgi:hypothetical protein
VVPSLISSQNIPDKSGREKVSVRGEIVMQNQSSTTDTQRLLMTYSPAARNRNGEAGATPSGLAEAAIRILGACLLLYQQQVPSREYYEVHQTQ